MKFFLFLYRFFCSLRLAVFTLSTLAVLCAIGTFYESLDGREAAQQIIYRSPYMTIILFCLALNIIAVMISRWPWRKKHIPFLLAHFGIIFVITGAFITRFYGVDGTLRLGLKQRGDSITTLDSTFSVYSSFDGKNLSQLFKTPVYFFKNPPQAKKPFKVYLGKEVLTVTDFYPLALGRQNYEPSLRGGPALRLQLEGEKAHVVKWLYLPPLMNKVMLPLGPADIVLKNAFTKESRQVKKQNKAQEKKQAKKQANALLVLVPKEKALSYELHSPKKQYVKKGVLKKGSVLKTGWMDFRLRVLEYLPKALPNTIFTPHKTDGTPAIKVEFKGTTRWMGLNSYMFFFEQDKAYIVSYMNEKKPLGFSLKLKSFKVTRWPSSFKAASYESEVLAEAGGMAGQGAQEGTQHIISMNKPLKHKGYTIYQSGFEEDETGQPISSIFAINKDPGRGLKYFGSFLIVLGSVLLFWRRNKKNR